MERAEHAAAQLIAEQQANAMSVAAVAPAGAEPIAMEVDVSQPVASGSGTKRKAEDSAEQDESKKPRIGKAHWCGPSTDTHHAILRPKAPSAQAVCDFCHTYFNWY